MSAYDTIGNGNASKWGDDPYPGSGAIVTWGYVPDGTTVDPEAVGVEGTSNLSQIRNLFNTNHGEGAFEAAIERAFATWSAVANITFIGPVDDPGDPLGAVGAVDANDPDRGLCARRGVLGRPGSNWHWSAWLWWAGKLSVFRRRNV